MALPRLVIVLSLVSLANDAASEMITPLLPVFLTVTLGAGAAVVGLVEGVAEATASFLKLLSGRLADRGWSQRGLVLGGYCLSSLARPLIGVAGAWPVVLGLRFLDRAGKGIRTSPRDALISAAVADWQRGYAFGFHRALDHIGSIAGPLFATALLAWGTPVRTVFFLSVIPSLAVLGLLLAGLEKRDEAPPAEPPVPLAWSTLDPRLRALVLAAGALALAVAPEAFMVLWAMKNGLALALVPLLWSAASLVKSASALLGGRLSDHLGRRALLLGGWMLRSIVLVVLAFLPVTGIGVWTLFFAYALTLAVTEGPERALIGDAAAPTQRATAFGLYYLVYGLMALPGALLFGELWQHFGPAAAFLTAAGLTAAATAIIGVLALSPQPASQN
jgi:MFS family permease